MVAQIGCGSSAGGGLVVRHAPTRTAATAAHRRRREHDAGMPGLRIGGTVGRWRADEHVQVAHELGPSAHEHLAAALDLQDVERPRHPAVHEARVPVRRSHRVLGRRRRCWHRGRWQCRQIEAGLLRLSLHVGIHGCRRLDAEIAAADAGHGAAGRCRAASARAHAASPPVPSARPDRRRRGGVRGRRDGRSGTVS